jgi:hypothetical protein
MADKVPQPVLKEIDLRNWRLIERFQMCLPSILDPVRLHPSFRDPKRLHTVTNYLSLYLFGLFNPAIKTMRGLCQASQLDRVAQEICGRRVSLGSFSETQPLLDPILLEEVFSQLSSQVHATAPRDPQLGQWEWLAQDGSLFAALPRMHWALYGGGDPGSPNRAVRLHLSLNLLDDKPQKAAVRPGKACERKVWKENWKKGEAYVGDRNYGQDYRFFVKLMAKGCAFILRLLDGTIINVLEELPLTPADEKAGVFRQAWVTLGRNQQSGRLRVVWIRKQDGGELILATNLASENLSAELVSMLYRKRWKIEMFFRWVKCILNCRHWLAESPEGVAIQIYLALIAALLLQLYMGQKPNKRMMELIQMHQLGWASDQELIDGLKRERDRMAAKKKV